jgi:glycosyltransferase involved in cell wall biosynthesis
MEFFYRQMRKKYSILLEQDGNPTGGHWNYDKENRKPPKIGMKYPRRISHKKSPVTQEVLQLVGKFFPNGYSKGIEDLLGLSRVNQNSGKRLKISITGGTQFEVDTLNKLIQRLQLESTNLIVNSHLSHDQALQKMKELDVIVLPIPTSKEYVGFPLKSIEALASGRIVVAAKCRVYTDIFVEDFQPYWYVSENPQSLFMAIAKALGDNELEARITSGLKFAEQFTWDIRTKNLLSELTSGVQE